MPDSQEEGEYVSFAVEPPPERKGPKMTRLQVKEAIKMAYVSGRATLAEMAEFHGLPISTVNRWSAEEGWGKSKLAIREQVESKAVSEIANWVQKEREAQIRRAIGRGTRLQSVIDKTLAKEEFAPAELRDLATAEDKVDGIIRRNLGMEDASNGSGRVNVNVLGSVSIVET